MYGDRPPSTVTEEPDVITLELARIAMRDMHRAAEADRPGAQGRSAARKRNRRGWRTR